MNRTNITLKYRLRGSSEAYEFLSSLSGANRYLWNKAIEKIQKDYKETGKADTRFVALGRWFYKHKKEVAPWLCDYPTRKLELGLKDVSTAYRRKFKKLAELPKFKSKKDKYSFRINLTHGEIKENKYLMLKRGLFMKMVGHDQINRYSNPKPKEGRIIREVEDRSNPKNKTKRNKFKNNKWYLYVKYEVDAEEVEVYGNGVGIDRNVNQVTDSNGVKHQIVDVSKYDDRIKILQKRLETQTKGSNRYEKTRYTLSRYCRKARRIKNNNIRHTARELISSSNLVYLEDLIIKNLVKSAKGTIDNPGKMVKQKSGLNRVIHGSKWGYLDLILNQIAIVHKVPPKNTSRKCSSCGFVDKGNRTAQAKFKCLSCGFSLNADFNAAINIWTLGTGDKSARGVCIRPIIIPNKRHHIKRENEYLQ